MLFYIRPIFTLYHMDFMACICNYVLHDFTIFSYWWIDSSLAYFRWTRKKKIFKIGLTRRNHMNKLHEVLIEFIFEVCQWLFVFIVLPLMIPEVVVTWLVTGTLSYFVSPYVLIIRLIMHIIGFMAWTKVGR